MLPRRWRAHLTALYGFARLTDDIGDEPLPGLPPGTPAETVTATRLKLLDELQADVARIYDEQAPEPDLAAIKALKRTVRDCAIPAQPLYDLIQANRQDQLVTRYETYQDLEDYCKLSANPVGQVVLYIMGAATPDRIARLGPRLHRPAGHRAHPGRRRGPRQRPGLPAQAGHGRPTR